MNKIFLSLVFLSSFLNGCDSPSCPKRLDEDVDGIYSKNLGSVTIRQEKCEILEQYMKSNCSNSCNFVGYNNSGKSELKHCYEKTLTRITKCSSGQIDNTITFTTDKFHKEQLQ